MTISEQTIFRRAKDKDNPYVMIDRTVFENPDVSWKAKGLMGYLLSRPDDWDVRMGDLVKRSTNGMESVRSAVKELEHHGYLVRCREHLDNGRFQWNITVHEVPVPCGDEPSMENPSMDHPQVENPTLTNKDLREKGSTNITPPTGGDTVVEIDLVDATDLQATCPNCGGTILIQRLDTSRGECPHCLSPVRVRGPGGDVIVKVAQKHRRKKNGASEWLVAVRAFCELTDQNYARLPGKKKGEWARVIQQEAGDVAGPQEVAQLIPDLEVWGLENLTTPRMDRFSNALAEALMDQGEPKVNVTHDGRRWMTDDVGFTYEVNENNEPL